MGAFGKNFVYELPETSKASSDMGNVTYVRPGFQGIFFINTGPEHPPNHSAGFAKGAGTRDSFERAMACAKGLAAVACRVLRESWGRRGSKVGRGKGRGRRVKCTNWLRARSVHVKSGSSMIVVVILPLVKLSARVFHGFTVPMDFWCSIGRL